MEKVKKNSEKRIIESMTCTRKYLYWGVHANCVNLLSLTFLYLCLQCKVGRRKPCVLGESHHFMVTIKLMQETSMLSLQDMHYSLSEMLHIDLKDMKI